MGGISVFVDQGRQGSRGCIPGSPGESGLVSRVTNLESGAGEGWQIPEATRVSGAACGSQSGQKDPVLQDREPVL